MSALKLWQAHRHGEAIEDCRRRLAINADDIVAADIMASALRAIERHEEAIPLFERVGLHERAEKLTPGHPGRHMDLSCLQWVLGKHEAAIQLMRDLVDGILDGSIQYGDAAGGVEQGLLLYYMAITDNKPRDAAFALDYMRNRAQRIFIDSWPGPVAKYYLGMLSFPDLIELATGQRRLSDALDVARTKLLSRRHLCLALFHDGVRSRAEGDEQHCLARMRECYGLEDPLIEQEWYLARYEVQKAQRQNPR